MKSTCAGWCGRKPTAAEMDRERCAREIARCESELRGPDIGAVVGWRDWIDELRMLDAEASREVPA